MAEAVANIRLEYAPNTIELWRIDDAGAPMSFALDTVFYIERVDDNTASLAGSIVLSDVTENEILTPRGKATVTISPSTAGVLYVAGDELYNHNMDEFIHIYALKSATDATVYLAGSVQIYEVAGP